MVTQTVVPSDKVCSSTERLSRNFDAFDFNRKAEEDFGERVISDRIDILPRDNPLKKMSRYCVLILLGTVTMAMAQINYNYNYNNGQKPGSCPPSLPVAICTQACAMDFHCQGIGKCCRTSCGGTTCSLPVTPPRPSPAKAGSCPAQPTGRWVCSSTCNNDNDCRGTKKCCKNRCGALACQLPEVEVVESDEIPVVFNRFNANEDNPNMYDPNEYNPIFTN